MSRIAAIILAAGRGERAGQSAEGPKQYRKLGGKSVIRRSLEIFLEHDCITEIVIAIHPDDRDLLDRNLGEIPKNVTIITGGATRQASTLNALEALEGSDISHVLIHDAARPFTDRELIGRVVAGLRRKEAILPAMPVSDTIKRADDQQKIVETLNRDALYAAQTPQGFSYRQILQAHRKAHELGKSDFTDDAAIASWAGLAVTIVRGAPENIKLTWERDLVMAEQRLAADRPNHPWFPDVRTGNGYDVHCFGPGDHVILCGVKIPFHKSLTGHSDADVGLHALTDAMLATCGDGDIGTHFPPSDPQWRGAASHIFAEHAAKIVRDKGGRITLADVTFITEDPKIGPHRTAMVAMVSEILDLSPDRISVKASTNERLGFIGRGEGIAAIATVTAVFPGDVPK